MSDTLAEVVRRADEGVVATRDRVGDRLDYSVASLVAVEELLSEAAPFFDELPPSTVTGVVEQLGCYVLEVARRSCGGRYAWHEQHQQPVLVAGEPEAHVAIMAWDKVLGRLKGDPADNIPFFFDGFLARARSPRPGDHVLFV